MCDLGLHEKQIANTNDLRYTSSAAKPSFSRQHSVQSSCAVPLGCISPAALHGQMAPSIGLRLRKCFARPACDSFASPEASRSGANDASLGKQTHSRVLRSFLQKCATLLVGLAAAETNSQAPRSAVQADAPPVYARRLASSNQGLEGFFNLPLASLVFKRLPLARTLHAIVVDLSHSEAWGTSAGARVAYALTPWTRNASNSLSPSERHHSSRAASRV